MEVKETLKSMTKIVLSVAVVALLIGVSGCKSKKPVVVQTQKKVKKTDTKVVQARATLKELLSPNCTKSLEEKEKILAGVKSQYINDPEVKSLIKELEGKIAKEKEAIRIAREKAYAESLEAKPKNRLTNYFSKIANAPNEGAADQLIRETLGMFTSDNANVLVIVNEENGQKDYDRPTKIGKYLNYLKTTKNNNNKIDEMKWVEGKIKTLILRKIK